MIGRDAWDGAFKFSIVRNPWDKVFSHYQYRVQTNQTNLGNMHLSFPEWVKHTYGERDERYIGNPKMFLPQVEWIKNDEEEIDLNFIGRFENLDRDFKTLCERLGKDVVTLPHLKASNRGPYQQYYDEGSIDIVADFFSLDLDEFGYSYE